MSKLQDACAKKKVDNIPVYLWVHYISILIFIAMGIILQLLAKIFARALEFSKGAASYLPNPVIIGYSDG